MAFTCLDVIVPRRNPRMFVMLLWVKGELGIAYHLDGKRDSNYSTRWDSLAKNNKK